MIKTEEYNEPQCKWFFPICNEGSHERGLNNAMFEHFRSQSQYTTLVRESIQNSLDAVLDEKKPVVMRFDFLTLNRPYEEMPNLMDIRKYIKGCIDYWGINSDIKNQYNPMLNYLESCKEELLYLKVSDYNTRGMDYNANDNNCTFFAFLRADGTSVKNMINSGGSFGFGKMAYFGLSQIRTIIVSTMNKSRKVAFEGAAMLCTNKVDGVKYMDVGYYDTNNGYPITDKNEIPEFFKREEPGTDINIIGLKLNRALITTYTREIICAVLKHFWMAIYEQRLEVHIGDILINKNSLHSLMLQYFPLKVDAGAHYENPRAYYEVVIKADKGTKDFELYEDDIKPLGKCRFYIGRNRGSRDRYLAMRSPLMVVQAYNSQSNRGYSGVFICDDKEGNDLLKMSEPPAHDKWDRGRVQNKYEYKYMLARKAINEVRNYTQACINDFFQNAEQDYAEIRGIDQFLYNSSKEESKADISNRVKAEEGEKSSEYTDVENGSPVGSIDLPPKSYKDEQNLGHITVSDTVGTNYGEDIFSGKSTNKLKSKVSNPQPRPGTNKITKKKSQEDDGPLSNVEIPIEVAYRCFALNENGKTFHKLVLHSDKSFDNVTIRLKSATADPYSFEEIPIVWASEGQTSMNMIQGIHIEKGKNVFKFRFSDNLSHAINLEAYYEEK